MTAKEEARHTTDAVGVAFYTLFPNGFFNRTDIGPVLSSLRPTNNNDVYPFIKGISFIRL